VSKAFRDAAMLDLRQTVHPRERSLLRAPIPAAHACSACIRRRSAAGKFERQRVDSPSFPLSRDWPSGHLWRNRARAARTTVVENKAEVESDATTGIEVSGSRTCDDLSQKIVAARRGGHEVALRLPPG
jgi:hypothetical protein